MDNIEKIKKTLWLHTLPAEEENTLEEFAWAFGEDTVNEIEKRVHQVISHLHHWPSNLRNWSRKTGEGMA